MKNIVDFQQFDAMYDGKSYIALGRELYVDLETPVSIFLKVSKVFILRRQSIAISIF